MRLAMHRPAATIEHVDIEVREVRSEARLSPLGDRPRLPGGIEVRVILHAEPVHITPLLIASDEPNVKPFDFGNRRTDRPSGLHGAPPPCAGGAGCGDSEGLSGRRFDDRALVPRASRTKADQTFNSLGRCSPSGLVAGA